MQQAHRLRGDQRRLFGGFGDHGIAGRQRGGDLAEKNRQRKIPRTDANEYAATVQGQGVGLAGRSRQRDRSGKFFARLRGIVATEINRLAHLRDRIRLRTPALPHDQRGEFR